MSKIWSFAIIISIVFYIACGMSGNFVTDVVNSSKTTVQIIAGEVIKDIVK